MLRGPHHGGHGALGFVRRLFAVALGTRHGAEDRAATHGSGHDGDLDLLVAPTYPSHYPKLYRNDGWAGFVDVTYEAGIAVHMGGYAVASDVDEDGDLDLLITGVAPSANTNLFLNTIGNKNNWVSFDLRGAKSNRDGVGAKVVVTAGGITQTRELKGGGGGTPPHGSHGSHGALGRRRDGDVHGRVGQPSLSLGRGGAALRRRCDSLRERPRRLDRPEMDRRIVDAKPRRGRLSLAPRRGLCE